MTLPPPPPSRPVVRIEPLPADGAVDLGRLSDDERARWERFGSAERRRQFALGRIAARTLLAERWGGAAREAPLAVGAAGGLDVVGHAAFVSVAHAGRGFEAVGVAALADGPVGVDAEAVGPRHPDLWRRILRPDEASALDALGGPTDASVTLLWALKEAVLKGQRTGLRAGARSVRLELDGDGHARATSDRSGDWHLRYEARGGVWVAVAWQPTGS